MKASNIITSSVVCLTLAVGFVFIPSFATAQASTDSHEVSKAVGQSGVISEKRLGVNQALRDLWGEHVFWTRAYIVAAVDENTTARDVAAEQVVANAREIADAVAGFYGKEGGDQAFALLGDHWGAVKAYDDATSDEARRKASDDLAANGKEISQFLSKANPYLTEEGVFGLLVAHAQHHIQQTTQLKAGDYANEAQTWEAMRRHMYVLSDALTDALAKQFPDQF